jgi:hypothetical protein
MGFIMLCEKFIMKIYFVVSIIYLGLGYGTEVYK